MKPYCWVLVASLAFLGTGCRKAPSSDEAPQLLRPAFIKDIMDSMVNPSGEFVFDSVYQISDEHGIREKAPHTDADWEEVRQRVVILPTQHLVIARLGDSVDPTGDIRGLGRLVKEVIAAVNR